MKFLAVAVFFVVVAYARAGAIGLPLAASRGALEGALGGQWIPDVPVAGAPLAAPLAAAPLSAVGGIGLPVAATRGALEGALGGKWIPDVPAAGAPLAAPLSAAPWAAAPLSAASWAAPSLTATSYIASSPVAAPVAAGWGAPVLSRGDLEGALGGQWVPDVLPEH